MEETVQIPLLLLLPFVLMLLCIAVAPLTMAEKWESNRNKLIVSIVLSIPVVWWMISNGLSHDLIHQMVYDYVPFIVLLLALFVVTGGIHIGGDIQATPLVNTIILAIGWVLASFMGTTGAAMLLIRPLITTNQQRKYKVHTMLFFIAVVANCGGLLTPLGDPPLFMLFLRGASFGWFMHLFPIWAVTGVLLLAVYFIMDSYYHKKEPIENLMADKNDTHPFTFGGGINIVWLLAIIACVIFINSGYIHAMADEHAPFYIKLLREWALIAIIFLSWYTTKKVVRIDNNYSWAPIVEVAYLFLGIFATMTPALMFLRSHAADLGLDSAGSFYFATGALSSFLDNTPTAVAFHTVATGLPESILAAFAGENTVAGIPEILLEAVACGAVLFGAMTYIGNGPNFMVKAIAEQNKIDMPSFFGYIAKFAFTILLPVYVIVWLIFFF